MKYKLSKSYRDMITCQMLYLRYQSSHPLRTQPEAKPKALMSMSKVSRILNVPLETLNWMNRKYFNPQVNTNTGIAV